MNKHVLLAIRLSTCIVIGQGNNLLFCFFRFFLFFLFQGTRLTLKHVCLYLPETLPRL